MAKKSIWNQISNPRDEYTDGYGVSRPVYEPGYITVGRKIYNGVDEFLNGPDNVNGMPINKGAGALEFFFDPAGAVGKADDVAMLVKNLDAVKDKWDNLRRFQLRRKVNGTSAAQKSLERKAQQKELDVWDWLVSERGRAFDEGDFLDGVAERVSRRVDGDPYRKMQLQLDRVLDPIAKEYNAALKAGDIQKASELKHQMAKMVRSQKFDKQSPYVDSGFWEEVNTRLFDPRNGGSGLTPKEKQTLLLDVEYPW